MLGLFSSTDGGWPMLSVPGSTLPVFPEGRTVREVTIAGTGITVACIYAHHVFLGYYTAEVYNSGVIDLVGIYSAEGAYAAIVAVWQTLPGVFRNHRSHPYGIA